MDDALTRPLTTSGSWSRPVGVGLRPSGGE